MPEAGAAGAPAGDWLDWTRAMALVDEDTGLLHHLVGVFVKQYSPAPAELRQAMASADWKLAARRAHQLAGAAGAIGAVVLERLAGAADSAAQAMLTAGGNHDVQQRARLSVDALVDGLEATLLAAGRWYEEQAPSA